MQATTKEELTSKDKFKLMVLSPEFKDDEVFKAFLDLEISDVEDIDEVIGILSKHRSEVVKKIKLVYPPL